MLLDHREQQGCLEEEWTIRGDFVVWELSHWLAYVRTQAPFPGVAEIALAPSPPPTSASSSSFRTHRTQIMYFISSYEKLHIWVTLGPQSHVAAISTLF